eukprot:436057-Pyramimonas_sp.AAC.1
MLESAAAAIPPCDATPRRPWISSRTLHLVDQRNITRNSGANSDVCSRRQTAALDGAIDQDGWGAMRSLQKRRAATTGRLRNLSGNLVDAEQRPETMAEYLEQ